MLNISIASATFFYLPFEKSLFLISRAGFKNIELDIYWKGGEWEIAQHLKDIYPKDVIKMVADHGLNIHSIHDAGGVVDEEHSSAINPSIYKYLELIENNDLMVVLHTPTSNLANQDKWWNTYKKKHVQELSKLSKHYTVLIENLDTFEGYYDPLHTSEDLYAFTLQNSLGVNIDTGHYAADTVDIFKALEVLKNTKAVHLNDHRPNERHVFVGEGVLNLKGFVKELKKLDDCTITLECSMGVGTDASDELLIDRLKQAKRFVEDAIE